YPYLSRTESDSILMPVNTDRRVVRLDHDASASAPGDLLLGVIPEASTLEVLASGERGSMSLGRFPLKGRFNLGSVLPVAIDAAPGLVAIADRSGGVHLIELQWRPHSASFASAEAGR
ncbi:MAG TPA: hypothetical protein VFT74_04160, partial [Isosphaeraceae bacterium]|nr:hypothetical protein [Isosphaeraceae bacterium]